MGWKLVALAVVVPTLAGLLVSALCWALSDDPGVGTAVGAALILLMGLLFFGHEYVELSRMHQACIAAGKYCPAMPGDFNRYMLVAFITFIDIGLLYMASLFLEERGRRSRRRVA